MNPILSALNSGYSAEEVLKYMSKSIPEIVEPIKKASRMGYNTQQILGYLSKSVTPRNTRGMSESQIHAQNRMEDNQRVKNGLSMAAAAVAVPVAANAARSALSRALPLSVQNLTQSSGNINTQPIPGAPAQNANIMPQQQQQPQQQNPLSNPSQPPVNQPNIQQQKALPQPEVNTIDAEAYLKSAGVLDKVNDSLSRGNTPEAIAAEIGIKRSGQAKIDPELLANIEAYAQKKPDQSTSSEKDNLGFKEAFKTLGGGTVSSKLYEGIFDALQKGKDTFAGVKDSLLQAAKPAFDAGQIKSVEDLKRFAEFWEKSKKNPPEDMGGGSQKKEPTTPPLPPEKITKRSLVDTPQGIGEVKEIRNGKALVEVDGKIIQMLEDELINSPYPEKDLAELHDELLKGIEKETGKQVSRHVNTAAYDPENKELAYHPWGDKMYVYDVDKEDVDMLTQLLTQRKTSGENFIGAWEEGTESPIGAAMHVLITKLKNKAKESGKEKAHKRRYETIYSAYEPAEAAAKRKKDEERKRKKEEEKQRRKAARSPVSVS